MPAKSNSLATHYMASMECSMKPVVQGFLVGDFDPYATFDSICRHSHCHTVGMVVIGI